MENLKAKQISIIVFLAIALFATAFFVTSLNVSIANADDDQYIFIPYAGELKDLSGANPSSYVFTDEQTNKTFKLTQTYYVKYISSNDDKLYKVSFGSRVGYIEKNSKLQPQKIDGVTDLNCCPDVTLTLKDGVPFKSGVIEYTSDYTFKYLGESENGKICVLCEKDVTKKQVVETDKSNFNAYAVPLHQVTQAAKDKLSSGEKSQMPDGSLKPKTETNKTLRGLLIAGIVVPAVIIIIFIFIPRKKKQTYDSFAASRPNPRRSRHPMRYRDDYEGDYNYNDNYRDDYGDYKESPSERDYRNRDFRRDGYRDYDDDNRRNGGYPRGYRRDDRY